MSCKISIRACPKPNDFFDEMIADGELDTGDWILRLERISSIGTTTEGKETEVEIRWLFAEIDCEPEQLKETLAEKKPVLLETLHALKAYRQTELQELLDFTYWCEEYETENTRGNIHPYQINIGIELLNVQRKDSDGNIIFDACLEAQKHAQVQTRKAREAAKVRLTENVRYMKFLSDPYYRRAWESYGLALADDDRAIGQLYNLRDAVIVRIPKSLQTLGFTCGEWNRFGKLLNNTPLIGGRHSGTQAEPLRPPTAEERAFFLEFADKLLLGFGKFLEAEEQNKHTTES
jgi:hypothetical protein